MLDACLMGDASKAVRMLQSLEQEGEPIMRIATLVAFELRKLCSMSWSKEHGSSLAIVFRENRVWQAKQRIYASALERYPARAWQQLLQRSLNLDKMIKGQQVGNSWLTLESLMLVMAGRKQFAKGIVRE